MKVTYYLEVLSSWCHWAEPTWAELKARYAGRVDFDWKIALMRPEDFPTTLEQNRWYYQRSGGTVMRSPYALNPHWFEPERRGVYDASGLVCEAGRDLGVTDDRIRLALAHAALREGQKIGDLDLAVAIAAKAGGVAEAELGAAARSAAVRARVDASTATFFSHQITQRPACILESAIGDKAVFSGVVRLEPLAATIDAMLNDAAAYAAHRVHFGVVPSA
jgi:predicted DsbA family dithiol-disulfide isomerase